jgi:BirA family biotin operon repressor/biotin-[acetyl-CoA-carboxylase] ligase
MTTATPQPAPTPTDPVLPAGWRRIALDAVASTNDEARARAAAGAPHGTVVTARRQTAGRGRRGAGWASPEGNLYASVVLRPDAPAAVAGQLAFVVAVALADAVAGLTPLAPRLKWPNDVILAGPAGGKLAGILLESEIGADGRVAFVIAGTGVNLAHHPAGLDQPVVDLATAGAPGIAPETFLAAYAAALDARCTDWQAQGFAPVRAAWRARAIGLGGPAEARLPDRTIAGVAEDLGTDGALLLRLPDGTLERISAGAVFFGPAAPDPGAE